MSDQPWIIDGYVSQLSIGVRAKLTDLDKLCNALPSGGEIRINAKFYDQLVSAFERLPNYPLQQRKAVGMQYRTMRLVN